MNFVIGKMDAVVIAGSGSKGTCNIFFKQKTAYELYRCDWSSDVCSSDLPYPMTGANTISLMMNFVIGTLDAVVIAGSSSYASTSSSYSEFDEIASAHPSEAFTSNRGLAFNLANSANLSAACLIDWDVR